MIFHYNVEEANHPKHNTTHLTGGDNYLYKEHHLSEKMLIVQANKKKGDVQWERV